MDFPHLQNATTFPGTDTRVYDQYRNVFDYNVWTPNTVIKLCHVNWYDDYHDVVKFPDNVARDAWFDKLDGETVKLTTNMYIARADTDGIKLPVPYMTVQQYNYIVVDFSHDIVNTPYQKTDVQTRYHFSSLPYARKHRTRQHARSCATYGRTISIASQSTVYYCRADTRH